MKMAVLSYFISVFVHLLQLQQVKGPSSSEVGMRMKSLQLLATIMQNGADCMICNQLDKNTVL